MNRKIKNTLALFLLLVIILVLGGGFIFLFQIRTINNDKVMIAQLQKNHYNTEQLTAQYLALKKNAASLDSILAKRKFNIPENLSSISFFKFVNDQSVNFSDNTQVNVEFVDKKSDINFFYYEYKITGGGDYNDLYKLIYSIE